MLWYSLLGHSKKNEWKKINMELFFWCYEYSSEGTQLPRKLQELRGVLARYIECIVEMKQVYDNKV